MRSKKFVLFLAAAMLLILSACAQIGTLKPAASASEPTSLPATQPALPNQTPTPINETVALTSQETETRNDELNLEIYLLQPVLSQPENKAEGFNQVVQALVQNLGNGLVDVYNVPTPMVRLPRHKLEKLVPFPVRR